MSWSCEFVGTRDEVASAFAAQMSKHAEQYDGKEEAKDIQAVRERALVMISQLDFEQFAKSYAREAHLSVGIKVSACGSNGSWGSSFKLEVAPIVLTITKATSAP